MMMTNIGGCLHMMTHSELRIPIFRLEKLCLRYHSYFFAFCHSNIDVVIFRDCRRLLAGWWNIRTRLYECGPQTTIYCEYESFDRATQMNCQKYSRHDYEWQMYALSVCVYGLCDALRTEFRSCGIGNWNTGSQLVVLVFFPICSMRFKYCTFM